jgi:putative ABC transport system permease protein
MGVLETIGLTKPKLMALIACEGIGLGLAGGALGTGVVLGLLWLRPVTLGVEGYGIDLSPGLATLGHSLLAALLTGILASLPPAVSVARRPLHLGVTDE